MQGNQYSNNNWNQGRNSFGNINVCKDVKYINPYNFISLPKKCSKIDYSKYHGMLTG